MSDNNELTIRELVSFTQAEFTKFLDEIAAYLVVTPITTAYQLFFQKEESPLIIPDTGKRFGVHLDNDRITISRLMLDVPKRVEQSILQFLTIREVFRLYFNSITEHLAEYEELIDIVLNFIALLWFIDYNDYPYLENPHINMVRSSYLFEDDAYFKHQDWDSYLYFLYVNKIPPKVIYDKLVALTQKAFRNNWSKEKYIGSFRQWLDSSAKIREYTGLPFQMEERHKNIIKVVHQLGKKKSSPKNVGKQLNKKHDVITTGFKELYEYYNVYWCANINQLALKLYPYFFRILLKDQRVVQLIIERLKAIPYARNIYFGKTNHGFALWGYFSCPHIIHNHFDAFLRKLLKEKQITDYFYELMQRKKYTCSITKEPLVATMETYERLLTDAPSIDFKTLVILDEKYDLLHDMKYKKAFFREDVLNYLSTLRASYLTKAYYMFYVKELEEFYEKKHSRLRLRGLTYFINQYEIRCLRLGVLNYYLNIGNFYRKKFILAFELKINPEAKLLEELLRKLSFAFNTIYYAFKDRVILSFPHMRLDNLFRKAVEKLFQTHEVDYFVYTGDLHPELDRMVPYHELYDNKNQRWHYKS